MRTGLKRLLVRGYCHGWIRAEVVAVGFWLFQLKGA